MVTGLASVVTAWLGTSWPKTTAIISESKIEERSGEDVTWGSIIIYEYKVNGQQFTGDWVYPGDGKSSSHRLWFIRNAPVESTRTVHYRSSNPATAYLEVGVQRYTFTKFLMGSLVLSFGGVAIIVNFLVRRAGVPSVGGEYTFPLDHPVSKVCMASFALIAAQFGLLFFCAR